MGGADTVDDCPMKKLLSLFHNLWVNHKLQYPPQQQHSKQQFIVAFCTVHPQEVMTLSLHRHLSI